MNFRLIYCCIALFMWGISLLFSKEYYAHGKKKTRYYLFLLLTMFATLGVFLAADLLTMFIFFEVMSLSSYVWVAQEETPEALNAGRTYLAVAVIGGMFLLMGLLLLHHAVGTLQMDSLFSAVQHVWETKSSQIYTAGFLMLVGFGSKAGLFPLHFWLPKAHPVAPAPASALLSGILTKCGVFGILILTAKVFFHDFLWGSVILALGTITMVVGAVLAVFSVDLKRTLACSSVSQIGFIMVGIGTQCFLGEANALAVRGTFLHMVNHSLIKLLLFHCAGTVYLSLHALDLNAVRGFGRRKPFLLACFLMGSLSIGGIPFWSGYVSKTLLHEGIVECITHFSHLGENTAVFHAVEWAFLISGGFTVAYMLKLFVCLFVEKHPTKQQEYDEQKAYLRPLSKMVLGLAALVLVVLGFFPKKTMDVLATLAQDFLGGGTPEHAVHYFTWANLKGSLISVGIGILFYLLVIRKVFMKDGKYVDLWPKWLDMEKFFWYITWGILKIFGTLTQFPDRLPEATVGLFQKNIFWETTEAPEHALVDKLHTQYDRKVDTIRLIGSSLSFGLLLSCIGLILTIVYLLIH